MSQIEQQFRLFLSKHPEIESCYAQGLINRRSLARHLIKKSIAKGNQLEAVIAMLRRYDFRITKPSKDLFKKIKTTVKDNIVILDFVKEKELVKRLDNLIGKTNYDKGDTLKIVVGSSSVKLFIDKENLPRIKHLMELFTLNNKNLDVSEISILFPIQALTERSVLSTITKQFTMHGIVISELLTASPELLIYLKEEYVLKAYEILKSLQK